MRDQLVMFYKCIAMTMFFIPFCSFLIYGIISWCSMCNCRAVLVDSRPRSVNDVAHQDEVVAVLKKSLHGGDVSIPLCYCFITFTRSVTGLYSIIERPVHPSFGWVKPLVDGRKYQWMGGGGWCLHQTMTMTTMYKHSHIMYNVVHPEYLPIVI